MRSAEQPGQAVNVDLCFTPEQHIAREKLPAVSGSSGRLIVERQAGKGEAAYWPGQIFGEPELDYAAAMLQYAQATQGRLTYGWTDRTPVLVEPSLPRLKAEGKAERYRVRQQRKQQDIAWRAAKVEHRQAILAHQGLSRKEYRQQQAAWDAKDQAWRKLRGQRQEILLQRRQEDKAWHQRARTLYAHQPDGPESRTWIAILVVTDNCTRQCLGLPVFRTGAKVTSRELVAALRAVLPEELVFLISDQGTHFRSTAFARLAQENGFIHIPVYRHRPQSNGIAERFVLTLKNWLRSKAWTSVNELEALVAIFSSEYNERPHQGLAIPGLSPSEFADRIWLM